MDPNVLIVMIVQVGGVVALVINAIRKRQDTSIDELRAKIEELRTEIKELRSEIGTLEASVEREQERRASLVQQLQAEQDLGVQRLSTIATLRSALAANGLADPTVGATP